MPNHAQQTSCQGASVPTFWPSWLPWDCFVYRSALLSHRGIPTLQYGSHQLFSYSGWYFAPAWQKHSIVNQNFSAGLRPNLKVEGQACGSGTKLKNCC